ncbi:hypothetical protein GCM10010112_55840 [Actinoplanes lobatus]|uniref:Lipoprotein n=1 Tax=Actinoplanes lobatus TaxID=113568 RepID=A0A7W7HEQ1_9ACTN|nr:hypothetical protein [Actinoplanes lobatus]MBB4749196.1 hypothetical protein [Actinoplanes lobatus]GGN80365.1 hypothetical protein GCM10010112_55840 [Actinoplanes lobatus]GIE45244.1 hypothetical protein Alo02nite_81420 [Actinoplanes lobatus]
MRALKFTGILTLVTLAGACSQPAEHIGDAARPATSATSATTPTAAPTTTAAKAEQSAADPCPVSAATLFEALRKSDLYEAGGKPDGMAKPNCYQGFAYGRSTFRKEPEGEIASVLFQFDSEARAWKALNLGTGEVCDGYVSPSVRDRLNQGTESGC